MAKEEGATNDYERSQGDGDEDDHIASFLSEKPAAPSCACATRPPLLEREGQAPSVEASAEFRS
jgi:hypothetical protein